MIEDVHFKSTRPKSSNHQIAPENSGGEFHIGQHRSTNVNPAKAISFPRSLGGKNPRGPGPTSGRSGGATMLCTKLGGGKGGSVGMAWARHVFGATLEHHHSIYWWLNKPL